MIDSRIKEWFSPSICLTHNCNLDCVYCYQNHNSNEVMTLETAKSAIDWIFENIPEDREGVQIGLIGGEPLLEFNLIKQIYDYVKSRSFSKKHIFFASTNGTVLSEDMKQWFRRHKENFILGLSLDGSRETHNLNRSNSYELIDFDFFLENYPNQAVKMTLSEFSINTLAQDIIAIHNKGFRYIAGVNLAEGVFDWSDEKYVEEIAVQLSQLVEFYLSNDDIPLNQMLNQKLAICEINEREHKKWCGIGTGAQFIDTDGKIYPCAYITPMTFSIEELSEIEKYDSCNEDNFVDADCYSNCYIYPLCPSCAGACYLKSKVFNKRDKSRCRIQKLIALFTADLVAKKLIKNPHYLPESVIYDTINSIKNIRELYLRDYPFLVKK